MKIIAWLLLIFSAFNSFGQKKATSKNITGEKKTAFVHYVDTAEKVSIDYPATWQRVSYTTSVFMFMRPVEEPGQKFRENVNLVTGEAQGLYLVEYLIDARRKMKEQMENFKELHSEYVKINGLDFVKMIYEFTNGRLVIKAVLYLCLKNGKAYSVSCTALNTTFDKYYPLFEHIGGSFRIK